MNIQWFIFDMIHYTAHFQSDMFVTGSLFDNIFIEYELNMHKASFSKVVKLFCLAITSAIQHIPSSQICTKDHKIGDNIIINIKLKYFTSERTHINPFDKIVFG